jgi:hypothetical protein
LTDIDTQRYQNTEAAYKKLTVEVPLATIAYKLLSSDPDAGIFTDVPAVNGYPWLAPAVATTEGPPKYTVEAPEFVTKIAVLTAGTTCTKVAEVVTVTWPPV